MSDNFFKQLEDRIQQLVTRIEHCHLEIHQLKQENHQLKTEKKNVMEKLQVMLSMLDSIGKSELHLPVTSSPNALIGDLPQKPLGI